MFWAARFSSSGSSSSLPEEIPLSGNYSLVAVKLFLTHQILCKPPPPRRRLWSATGFVTESALNQVLRLVISLSFLNRESLDGFSSSFSCFLFMVLIAGLPVVYLSHTCLSYHFCFLLTRICLNPI